jgi:phosphoribosylamine-glycine ligase
LINILSKLVPDGKASILESFGVSRIVEQIAELSGLSIPSAGSETSKFISRKSFSRTISKKMGIHIPDGEICDSAKEAIAAVRVMRSKTRGCPVVVKPELAAAGRGQLFIQNRQDIDRINDIISKEYIESYGTPLIVERWHPNAKTLSYEFHVDSNEYRPKSITLREALKDSENRDYGYLYPADVNEIIINVNGFGVGPQ